MECPNCKEEVKELKELSRGMGNQAFYECPKCGTVALYSGDLLTQYWPPENGQKKGVEECHVTDCVTSSDVSHPTTAAVIET